MPSSYHFLPAGLVSVPAANPSFKGAVNIAGGSLCVDGVAVIAPDRSGAFTTLTIGGDSVAPGPVVSGSFLDDAAAAQGGVSIGQCYLQAVTGLLRTRIL